MRKVLSAALVTGALALTVSQAIANPIMPVPAAPVFTVSNVTVPIQTQLVNGYRAVRAFWLNKAIVR
jgi:hypothetical protein